MSEDYKFEVRPSEDGRTLSVRYELPADALAPSKESIPSLATVERRMELLGNEDRAVVLGILKRSKADPKGITNEERRKALVLMMGEDKVFEVEALISKAVAKMVDGVIGERKKVEDEE